MSASHHGESAHITGAWRAGHHGRPGWRLTFDFDQGTIDDLKASVPPADRSYDPDTKAWWIAQSQEPAVLALLPGFEAFLAQQAMF